MRQKKTKQMLDYWMDLYLEVGNNPENHHRQIWPDRSDIQPSQCPSLLGDMFILETSNGRVDYRLAGTKLCAMYGRELKRESFGEVFIKQDQQSAENWAIRLAQDDYLALICSLGTTKEGRRLNMETLLLPLSHNGRVGHRVLGITVPCENPAWLGTNPIVDQTIRSVRVLHPWENQGDKHVRLQRPNQDLRIPNIEFRG